MEIIKYPDGSSYVDLTNHNPGDDIFKVNSYEDLWHLTQFVEAYHYKFGHRPTIYIPNLLDAQADRRFNDNHSSGLKLMCSFLNDLPADFIIFHPHNPEVVEALMDNVYIISNQGFIRKVLGDYEIYNHPILMSSDAGGFKPLMKLCEQLDWQGETYSASKARNHETGKLTQLIDREDFGGKDILIIDDICVYGGTFKGLANMLRERNVGKLYLAVSHMTVQHLGDDPVWNYFDKVFTTNSKYDYYTYGQNELVHNSDNLEVIKMFNI